MPVKDTVLEGPEVEFLGWNSESVLSFVPFCNPGSRELT